jgi:riboflavin kinase, archaea type
MSDVNFIHILTLAELLVMGAGQGYIEINTSKLGKRINKSQQAASKHLLELESLGFIARARTGQKFKVRVTDRGYKEIENMSSLLKRALEAPSQSTLISFEGKVVSGMGEGAYYMSLEGYRTQFIEKLGYQPYPGTLNVKLSEQLYTNPRHDIDRSSHIYIDGFSDGSRTYGWVKCYPADINDGAITDSAILILERTHYDNSLLEVIAPVCIKDYLGIRNGDNVKIRVHSSNVR